MGCSESFIIFPEFPYSNFTKGCWKEGTEKQNDCELEPQMVIDVLRTLGEIENTMKSTGSEENIEKPSNCDNSKKSNSCMARLIINLEENWNGWNGKNMWWKMATNYVIVKETSLS